MRLPAGSLARSSTFLWLTYTFLRWTGKEHEPTGVMRAAVLEERYVIVNVNGRTLMKTE